MAHRNDFRDLMATSGTGPGYCLPNQAISWARLMGKKIMWVNQGHLLRQSRP